MVFLVLYLFGNFFLVLVWVLSRARPETNLKKEVGGRAQASFGLLQLPELYRYNTNLCVTAVNMKLVPSLSRCFFFGLVSLSRARTRPTSLFYIQVPGLCLGVRVDDGGARAERARQIPDSNQHFIHRTSPYGAFFLLLVYFILGYLSLVLARATTKIKKTQDRQEYVEPEINDLCFYGLFFLGCYLWVARATKR